MFVLDTNILSTITSRKPASSRPGSRDIPSRRCSPRRSARRSFSGIAVLPHGRRRAELEAAAEPSSRKISKAACCVRRRSRDSLRRAEIGTSPRPGKPRLDGVETLLLRPALSVIPYSAHSSKTKASISAARSITACFPHLISDSIKSPTAAVALSPQLL